MKKSMILDLIPVIHAPGFLCKSPQEKIVGEWVK
jgi:hypothetical protein